MYSSKDVVSSSPSRFDELNNISPAISSLFSKSSAGPSLRTKPYSFQNSLYLSNDFSLSFVSASRVLFVTAFLIESTNGLF